MPVWPRRSLEPAVSSAEQGNTAVCCCGACPVKRPSHLQGLRHTLH